MNSRTAFKYTAVLGRLAAAVLCGFSALHAWDSTGHMAIAYICYKNLSPSTKTQVNAILQRHPDYSKWTKRVPAGSDTNQEAFLMASIWPDIIKRDPRFYDEGADPTPKLPGFPDMKVHPEWHYINVPVGPGKAAAPDPPASNIAVKINQFRKRLKDPYALSWLIHLVGDIHQPLHTVARFSAEHTKGDRGGNLFTLAHRSRNLHAYWDGVLGRARGRLSLFKLAESLGKGIKPEQVARLDTAHWLNESVELARTAVYSLTPGPGEPQAPAITPEYEARAVAVARERAALASLRLAALLNKRLP